MSKEFGMPRLRRGLALAWVMLGSMSAFACGACAAEIVQIDIRKFAFLPKDVTVAPGTTVVWVNRDETPHTLAASDGSFASKGLDTEDRYEHTFDSEGDVAYFCTVHPFMTGTLHVRRQ